MIRLSFYFSMICLWLIPMSLVVQAQDSQPPDDREVISAENAHRLEELAIIGRGVVYDAVWSPDGSIIAVASSIGIWLFDAHHLNNDPRLLQGHTGPVRTLAFHPNSRILASGSYDYIQVDPGVRLWDVKTGKLLYVLTGHTGNIGALTFSADGAYLITGGWYPDSSIRIWRFDDTTASVSIAAVVKIPSNSDITDFAISADSRFVVR